MIKRSAITLFLLIAIATPAAEVSISTFNVNLDNRKVEETIELLLKFDPDIMLLQETTAIFEKEAAPFLPAEYPYTWYTQTDQEAGGGFGVISKFPIVDKKFIEKTKGLFGMQTFGIECEGQTIHLMNLHLNPAGFPATYNYPTALHSMMMNNKIQAVEIRTILDLYKKDQPTIIAGDFNSFSNMAAYRLLAREGILDAHLAIDPKADEISTWTSSDHGPSLGGRFDYILHNRFFEATAFNVVKNPYSDHTLLNGILRFK